MIAKTREWLIEAVREAAAHGLTYARAANKLQVSKGTIAGVAHRNGIVFCGRAGPPSPPEPLFFAKFVRVDRTLLSSTAQAPVAPCRAHRIFRPCEANGVSFEALPAGGCRWPSGDPASDEMRFCAAPQRPGRPYCPAHCRIAYQRFSPAVRG